MISMAQPQIGQDEIEAVTAVMRSGMIASGSVVTEFEHQFANYVGMEFGVATSNGTTALHAALLGLGIEEGDKVITTPFTFIASSNAILFNRAIPVFIDIDKDSFLLDLDKLESYLESNDTNKIKAILVVHLFGLACDMPKLMNIAEKYNLKVIEDCAQSHGAEVFDRKAGSFGDAACFSFYPTKNMTTGEGGIALFKDKNVADLARKYVNHGRVDQYKHDVLGFNYRMTNMSAAIGIEQLKKLDTMNDKRRKFAAIYDEHLAGNTAIKTPLVDSGYKHVYHQYTVKLDGISREEVQSLLSKNEIGSAVVYPFSMTEQEFYQGKCECDGDVVARETSRVVLSLPVHPGLNAEDIYKVCDVLNSIEKGN